MSDNEKPELPHLYAETPPGDEPHVVNYTQYIGDLLRRFRNNRPLEERGSATFGKNVLGKYFGAPVHRNVISRIEKGVASISWGHVAAYLYEMKALPELIAVLERGRSASLRYMLLVRSELQPEIREALQEAQRKLEKRAEQETKAGYIRK